MKKLILAFVALAFAFAISSCCDQSRCPGNLRCGDGDEAAHPSRNGEERPYRWDKNNRQQQQNQERTRRW